MASSTNAYSVLGRNPRKYLFVIKGDPKYTTNWENLKDAIRYIRGECDLHVWTTDASGTRDGSEIGKVFVKDEVDVKFISEKIFPKPGLSVHLYKVRNDKELNLEDCNCRIYYRAEHNDTLCGLGKKAPAAIALPPTVLAQIRNLEQQQQFLQRNTYPLQGQPALDRSQYAQRQQQQAFQASPYYVENQPPPVQYQMPPGLQQQDFPMNPYYAQVQQLQGQYQMPGPQQGFQPSYQPDFQPDYQPGFQPDYQPGFQPDYQPGYRPGLIYPQAAYQMAPQHQAPQHQASFLSPGGLPVNPQGGVRQLKENRRVHISRLKHGLQEHELAEWLSKRGLRAKIHELHNGWAIVEDEGLTQRNVIDLLAGRQWNGLEVKAREDTDAKPSDVRHQTAQGS